MIRKLWIHKNKIFQAGTTVLSLAAAIIISEGCAPLPTPEDGNPDNDGIPQGYGRAGSSGYFLRSDTLYLLQPSCACEGNNVNTTPQLQRYTFQLSGDTLSIFTDRYDSVNTIGASVQFYLIYSRFDTLDTSSIGLAGAWRLDSIGFTHDKPFSSFDSTAAMELAQYSAGSGYQYVIIGTDEIRFYAADSLRSFSRRFTNTWNKYYAALVNINLTVIDSATVQLIGNISGDTVTIFENGAGNRYYARRPSARAYPQHVWYRSPDASQCPNRLYPKWFHDPFLVSNARL